MSISVLSSPAAGWYPDPAARAAFRWWDGATWTEGTHAGLAAVPEVLHVPVLQVPEVLHAPEAPTRAASTPAKTRWSSLLFAFPFVYPIAVGMVVALAYAGGSASNTTALIVIGAVVAVAAIVPAWVFADYDRRELVARGYEPAPSIAWLLLVPPIAYLLARRRVVGPSY